ncbi:hypothetical protein ACFY0Z_30080 [Streptomyces kronopolitis]|uniref:hypothetical protein n=1 Tax=Streptomyces kronopolitis TaxID=1612435 RepID=UPI003675D22F
MPRTINWPTRAEWQEKAEQAEYTSCFPRERVSSSPSDWLTAAEIKEGRKLSAKVVRATRIALGKADRISDRDDMNDWNRRALDEDADVDAVASGWWHIARYARFADVLSESADRLTALADAMRQARDEAAEEATKKEVAEAVARRATDAAWDKELQRRARIETRSAARDHHRARGQHIHSE